MARKKREYPTEFTAFWNVWSGRNAGADKTRSADIWDAEALNDETIRRIMSAAGSVPPDAVPMAWLRAVIKATPETISGVAADAVEPQTQGMPVKEKIENKDIQISENIPAEQPTEAARPDVQDKKQAALQAKPNDAGRQTIQANTTPEAAPKRKRGRPKKDVPTVAVMLHITPETRAWLKREAFETERTMSEIVDALVAAAGDSEHL